MILAALSIHISRRQTPDAPTLPRYDSAEHCLRPRPDMAYESARTAYTAECGGSDTDQRGFTYSGSLIASASNRMTVSQPVESLRKEFNTILRCRQTPQWPVPDLGLPPGTVEDAATTVRGPQLLDSSSSTVSFLPPSIAGELGEPSSGSPCSRTSGRATDNDEESSRLENPKERSRRAGADRTRDCMERRSKRVKALIGRTVSNVEYSKMPELKQEFNPQSWHKALITAKRPGRSRSYKTEELPLFHDINGHILASRASYLALTLQYEPIWTQFREKHYIVSSTGDRKMRPGNGLLLKLAKFAIPWYTEGIQTAARDEEHRKELLLHESKSIKQILSLDPLPQFAETFTEAGFQRYLDNHALPPTEVMIGDLLISPRPKVHFPGTDIIDRRTDTLLEISSARLS